MTGRQRILNALKLKKNDRAPWVPFVGCHGGRLIKVTAEEYLKSSDLMVSGIEKAIELYHPDGIPVAFDLQIEAEVFGCELAWAAENPPAVRTHPLANGKTLSEMLVPGPDDGRIKTVLEATRTLRGKYPDLALYGLITGPFTLALHLLGTDIFIKMFDEPQEIHSLMKFCRQVATAMAGYYIDAGCDVIAVVDPMTSQIGPEQFKEFVSPYIGPVFDNIRERGALSSFFVCGHAQQNIEVMCNCRPDNVSVDENIPLDYVRDLCLEKGVSFGGNLQLTTVLLLGTPADAQRNALECLEIGEAVEAGYVLAPGCDLPYATPPENLQAIAEIVLDPYKRDIAKTLVQEQPKCDLLDMRQYGQSDKIIIDIITLDSEACAPCQYMVESVKQVTPEFEDLIEWREHKIKYRESLVFMTSLMIHNIPTICIDGKITFVSRIPARDELIAAIQNRIYEKMRLRIRKKPATLVVLGDEKNEHTQELLERVRRSVTELGAGVNVRLVCEPAEILNYGITPAQLPAVVVEQSQIKSTRLLPEIAAIKEWVKNTQ